LKAYSGLYYVYSREWNAAAEALVSSLSTFTATELATFDEIVMLGSMVGLATYTRPELKSKIIDAPEVIGTLPHHYPHLDELINCLYTTSYNGLFRALANVELEYLKPHRFLSAHSFYFTRTLRQKTYTQLLSSYTSLSLQSIADSFAVSIPFIENDLEKMIADKKLCGVVIDKVNGKLEMSQVDQTLKKYEEVIQLGDDVIRKIQRYSSAVRGMV